MATISPKLADTVPGIFIRNMITSQLVNYPTPFLIANAVFLGSKRDIQMAHKLGTASSYEHYKCFKKSSAKSRQNLPPELPPELTPTHEITPDMRRKFVHYIVDNFDQDIFSQNGKTSTHILAVIEAINGHGLISRQSNVFPRLSKEEMKIPLPLDDELIPFYGEKKPLPPPRPPTMLSEEFLQSQKTSVQRASDLDFSFLQVSINE